MCENHLRNLAYDILGKFGMNQEYLNKHLKKYIYDPLGYQMDESFDIERILTNLIKLHKKSVLFEEQPLMTNYDAFEQSIKN